MIRSPIAAAAALALFAGPALADNIPRACAPAEPMAVCMLKVQRDNALDELALTAAQMRMQTDASTKHATALAAYWASYVKGLDHHRRTAVRPVPPRR